MASRGRFRSWASWLGGWLGRLSELAERMFPLWVRQGPGRGLPRAFWLFFAVFVAGMVLVSLVGDQGLIAYWRLSREADALHGEVARMEERLRELRTEIQALHDDPAYIEQLARQKLGLVRRDELVLQLPAPSRRDGEVGP